MNDDDFKLTQKTLGFKGYVSKPELTEIGPNFLVKGSKNVLIDFGNRIVSRKGYTLFGAANSGAGAIQSSYEWENSTGKELPLRVYDGRIEFYYNAAWNFLKSGMSSSILDFAKVWDNTEKIDILLWVLGDTNNYKWSGGVTKIRNSTSTYIRKQGVLSSVSTIAFIAGTPGTVAATITDSASNFLAAGFAAGDTLYVTGSANNSANFTIGTVTAGTITLIMANLLTSESAGTVVTLHNGEPTWASSRFLTAGTRKVLYNGVEYSYGGGELTDTLTGLVGFPTASAGDVVSQAVITLANPSAINANFKQDLIAVQANQVILASTKSQEVYVSKDVDYTVFTLTSPRAPGDPAKVVLDHAATCLVPVDNTTQVTSSLMVGAGKDDFFKITYQLSQDNTNELVRAIKLKTASGSGLIAKGAIVPVHNATVYISREPTLNTLGAVENMEGKTNLPLSDIIKNDFDSYAPYFTMATHLRYWKRALYITIPSLGIVLIYDLMRNLWQPPQTLPISRFAIIGDWLYGHSSVTNESYKLFTGTNDNNAIIPQVARLGYDNGGRRDRIKNLNEVWNDGYISAGAELDFTLNFDFDGFTAKKPMTIKGGDTSVVTPPPSVSLGQDGNGVDPLGGSTLDISSGLDGMLRFWQVDTVQAVDHIEHFIEFSMNTLNGQFALVATGTNQYDAGTVPVGHKK